MTRFITPAKIGLLVLIELYTESLVPNPSMIPILAFVLNQLLPSTLKAQKESLSPDSLPFILDLEAFEKILSAHPAAGIPGRTLWDYFLQKLWAIDSLDALHVYFDTRTSLLTKTKEESKKDSETGVLTPSAETITLSRTSPFGSFVRRSKVEFERLRFSDALALWMAFARWRQESKAYWLRRNGGEGRWAGDKALHEGKEDWGDEATEMLELVAYGGFKLTDIDDGGVSTDDVEKLLEFQVEQMQSELPGHLGLQMLIRPEFGNRMTPDTKDKLKGVLDESIMIPSLSHYLK